MTVIEPADPANSAHLHELDAGSGAAGPENGQVT